MYHTLPSLSTCDTFSTCIYTLLRTYQEVNLGEDAVYEEVGDHVHPRVKLTRKKSYPTPTYNNMQTLQ